MVISDSSTTDGPHTRAVELLALARRDLLLLIVRRSRRDVFRAAGFILGNAVFFNFILKLVQPF